MDSKRTSQLAAERAINILGGPAEAARILNVKNHSYQTVQSWLKNRVPAEYVPLLVAATRERGQEVSAKELRPDVAWEKLSVESGEPDAPPIEASLPAAAETAPQAAAAAEHPDNGEELEMAKAKLGTSGDSLNGLRENKPAAGGRDRTTRVQER